MRQVLFSLSMVFGIACATEPKTVSWDEVGESAPVDRVRTKLDTQADFGVGGLVDHNR